MDGLGNAQEQPGCSCVSSRLSSPLGAPVCALTNQKSMMLGTDLGAKLCLALGQYRKHCLQIQVTSIMPQSLRPPKVTVLAIVIVI